MQKRKLLLIHLTHQGQTLKNGFEPINLGIISSLTPKDAWDINMIDESWETIPYEKGYDIVAMSVITTQAMHAYDVSKKFQKTGAKVILGGYHTSALPEESLKYCDTVVVGLVENNWKHVLSDFKNNTLQRVYNNADKNDFFVAPDRSIFKYPYIFSLVSTSRGCNQNCSFCATHVINGKSRQQRPVEDIVAELKTLNNRFVFFTDDNFMSASLKQIDVTKELLQRIVQENINIRWIAFMSINLINDHTFIDLLKKSGCKMVFIGVESFDNESLKSLNKELVLKNISKLHLGIKYLHKRKIAVQTNIILGLPEDTDTHIRNRIVQAKSLGFDFLSFTALTPLPGTRIYKQVYDDLMQYNLNGKWNLFNFSNLLISRPDYTPENIENIHKKYKLKRNTKPLIKYISTFKTLIKTRNLKTTFFFYLLRTAYDSRLRKHRILRFLAKNS